MNRNVNTVINLSDTFIAYLFGALALGVAVVTCVLLFHWVRYSLRDPLIPFAQIIYFLGLCILFGITLLLLL